MNLILRITLTSILLFLLSSTLLAQQKFAVSKDTAGKAIAPVKGAPIDQNSVANGDNKTAFIEILESEYTDILKSGNENITKIVGNVKLRHGSDILYCDSAILFQERKVAEAFGNVSIEQADGTTAFADYLKYTGGSKVVYMKGNVILSDPKGNTLWSEEVDYNLSTKIGKYYKNGTLQNEQTILSSKQGEYNLKSTEARFKGDVVVNDPEYKATSEDLGYNTETKFVRFFADGIVQSDETTLFAKPGSTYDAIKKLAVFKGRSNIIHKAQFIEADEMKYNEITGWAYGKGNVIAIDTVEKATIWGGMLLYNTISGKLQVTEFPVIRRTGEDTAYHRGDTVFSEPIENLERPQSGIIDTAKMQMDELVDKLIKGVEVDSTKIPFSNDSALKKSVQEIDSLKLDNVTDIDTTEILNTPDSLQNKILDSLVNIKDPDDSIANKVQFPDAKELEAFVVDDTLDNEIAITDTLNAKQEAIIQIDETTDRPKRPEQSIGNNPATKIYEKSEAAKQNQDEENKPRYFLVYNNVLVFSDSAQAKCDSMRYSQADSLMILYKNPVIWGKGSQIIGDTIYALIDSSKIYEVYVPKNAILVQQNGNEKFGMFDQVQGNRLHAFFINNELDSALAFPNAETIYFPVDDDSAYIGASKASAERLKMHFKDRKIKKIDYFKDFNQVMTPMKDVNPQSFRLDRFNWREAERPKTLEAFLVGVPEHQKKAILGTRYKATIEENESSSETNSKPKPTIKKTKAKTKKR